MINESRVLRLNLKEWFDENNLRLEFYGDGDFGFHIELQKKQDKSVIMAQYALNTSTHNAVENFFKWVLGNGAGVLYTNFFVCDYGLDVILKEYSTINEITT